MTRNECYNLYLRHAAAFTLRVKVGDKDPDEKMMREIEEQAGVFETIAADFRKHLLAKQYALELLEDENLWEDKNYNPWWENEFFEQSLKQYAERH